MTFRKIGSLLALATAVSAAPAMAHETGALHGLGDGLVHPFVGLDHLLAMLAVGLWAATRSKEQAVSGPVTFLGFLFVGAVIGVFTGAGTALEAWVGGSLVGFSLLLLAAPFVGNRLGLGFIALFALLHGHAHGTEASAAVAAYFAGFLVSSAVLHLIGWRLGSAVFASPAGRWIAALGLGGTGLVLSLG
ncbi:HupE/UreJ family protein [Erythrobacter sp. SCSIO 43205]|uniref:HupE/UreJ family protein n=1 Tax=Erythrobacter sp. SCSIO 43205 TaxID=2779361 RepID=UPI001CAA1F00|nr:HupE/UreJ family protein [Erythrobacter sp. SCSIO 43205]UAB77852.1 HupE/UreJ family protein [Erythrobacter sp. SCSIO 43205]